MSTSLKGFAKLKALAKSPSLKAAVITVGMTATRMAVAQSTSSYNVSGLCAIPDILKLVVSIAGVAALFVWVLAHMSNKTELSDLTLKIGLPCVIAGFAGAFITGLGLSNQCSGIS